jgi:hypothetical protein
LNALPPEPTPVVQLFVPGSQQPPLQNVCSESPQVDSHTCETMLQARSSEQSAAELQPHLTPPRHTWPLKLMPQLTHAAPLSPHAPVALPVTQVLPEQQPPLHGEVIEQLVVHLPPLHAVPVGQSASVAQPHAPATQAWPIAFALQSTHCDWAAPHAVGNVPGAQVPFAQHAPLHGCTAEQLVVHACVVVLQAASTGQLVAPLQPHAPPFTPRMQIEPIAFPAQLTHIAPLAPHAPFARPVAQVLLAPSQQPPLHGWVAEQAIVQAWVAVLHDWPAGQSAAELQPHAPLTHAVAMPAVQFAHVPPPEPHALAAWPATQLEPEQQPPLQAE